MKNYWSVLVLPKVHVAKHLLQILLSDIDDEAKQLHREFMIRRIHKAGKKHTYDQFLQSKMDLQSSSIQILVTTQRH